ncbi:hypothetical protein [Candidatus Methylacidiphilum infernorum]|uniref:Uncharacterized protein n=1 Tax=Methylacidiphilum infernorum (isolate V4) TaxID=481448 RepID=B3E136_METI4|nr:hypothetical protein [Candidatus Methylacidiphilum infernorum]ACD84513.1 Hypothetical protein Minf_2459 [Methylacidiphilum infernorum V4]
MGPARPDGGQEKTVGILARVFDSSTSSRSLKSCPRGGYVD